MRWFILKSGMPMYDLERAYGLGLIIGKLTDEEVKVFDKGPYYEVETMAKTLKDVESNMAEILSLASKDIPAWENALRTTKGKEQKRAKKEKVTKVLQSECKEIIQYYSSLSQPERKGKKECLTGPLELSSFKGFRDAVRGRRYIEGSDFSVPEQDWALAVIGSLHFAAWRFIGESILILPCPDSERGVEVSHARSIKDFLENENQLNRTNVLSYVTHSAIRLYKELWNRARSEIPWMDRFSKLIYGSLAGTAFQPKPKTGGYFSLELFEELLIAENGGEILDTFDKVFVASNQEGLEDVAISFAEFLNTPVLESYSRFMGAFSRALMRGKVYARIKDEVWKGRLEENIWKEVIKYVRS